MAHIQSKNFREAYLIAVKEKPSTAVTLVQQSYEEATKYNLPEISQLCSEYLMKVEKETKEREIFPKFYDD